MAAHSSAPAPVAIVGAGPVGLALALGLARHGVRSTVLERAPRLSRRSKAGGIHVRTREVLRHWGVEDRFRDAGHVTRSLDLHDAASPGRRLLALDLGELEDEADDPGLLMLPQSETERLLLEAVRESGRCEVVFGAEVTGLRRHRDRVTLAVRSDGGERSVDASYVVGCDGARSSVRRALGLPFQGSTYRLRPMLADVAISDARDRLPWPRIDNAHGAFTMALRLRAGLWRVVRIDTDTDLPEDVPDREVAERVEHVLGPGPVDVRWSSRFRIHRRSSPRFRVGRVLLAGDAAHVHSPVGGLGMNAGIQDAHNLAWKLAAALGGGDVDRLLDSYEVERRAVVAGSLSRYTDLLTRLYLQAPPVVRGTAFAAQRLALRNPRLRRMALRRIAMLDLDQPPSPMLDRRDRAAGVRLPDVRLTAPDGRRLRLHGLLPMGPALLVLDTDEEQRGALRGERADAASRAEAADVLRIGPGGYQDPSGRLADLLGSRRGRILVRPDSHVTWARPAGA